MSQNVCRSRELPVRDSRRLLVQVSEGSQALEDAVRDVLSILSYQA
jgi:hypothetical protein